MALEHRPPRAADPTPTGPGNGRTQDSPDDRADADKQRLLRQATEALRAQGPGSWSTALPGRVMRAVRAEHRRGRQLSRGDPAHGHHIDENTAAKALRSAADNAGTALAGSCRLTPTADGRTIHATMTLTADPSRPLLPQADQVRQAVLHNAQHTLGLAVTRVDITIDDLHTPTTPSTPDRDAMCHD
ncbi:hypothetical protein ACWC9T_41525, partial [Kitasatospora sp. NPDC001159]